MLVREPEDPLNTSPSPGVSPGPERGPPVRRETPHHGLLSSGRTPQTRLARPGTHVIPGALSAKPQAPPQGTAPRGSLPARWALLAPHGATGPAVVTGPTLARLSRCCSLGTCPRREPVISHQQDDGRGPWSQRLRRIFRLVVSPVPPPWATFPTSFRKFQGVVSAREAAVLPCGGVHGASQGSDLMSTPHGQPRSPWWHRSCRSL